MLVIDLSFVTDTRGTLTILWNCLSIIILCTWNIQHLNILAQRPIPPDEKLFSTAWFAKQWQTLRWKILDSRTQLKWMLITVLMPEYIMGKAMGDRYSAEEARVVVQNGWGTVEQRFELIHGYFVNMGGYYLDFSDLFHTQPNPGTHEYNKESSAAIRKKSVGDELNSGTPKCRITSNEATTGTTVLHSMKDIEATTLTGNYFIKIPDEINIRRLKHNFWALDGAQLQAAKDNRLFQSLPYLSRRDIEALDDSNVLIKLLAIFQVCWLMIVRTVRKLPSSQLEIAALSFSVSSLITYFVLWERPRSITRRYRVPADRLPRPIEISDTASRGPTYLWTMNRVDGKFDDEYHLVPVPNDAIHFEDKVAPVGTWTVQGGTILGGVVFGGLHCLAWNFHFPTPTEALLWRICSVLTTARPVLSLYPNYLWGGCSWITENEEKISRRVSGFVLVIFFIIPYFLARLFLLVEMFRSLFYLPPDAFKETWSGSFPHWG